MRREFWIQKGTNEWAYERIDDDFNSIIKFGDADYYDRVSLTPVSDGLHVVELLPSEVILSREVLERTVDAISFIIKELRLDQNGSSWPEVLADLEAALK